MPQTLQCYKCGTQNTLGTRFCTVCGEKFLYRCPQCSATIEPGDEYCSRCAVKLDWGIPIGQQAATSSEPIKSVKIKQGEVKEREDEPKEKPLQRGMSPWLIAFIIIVFLIVAILAIDAVVKY